MNLEPYIWGPHYWATLHFTASTYDNKPNESIKLAMKNFIQSLPVFLPCKECQDHAFEFIKKSNINAAIQNRKELFTFFFNFHNAVNKRLKKPLMKMEDALKKYYVPKEEHYLYGPISHISHKTSEGYILFFVMVISIIIFYIIKNKNEFL